jgi:hypothetical protein
MLKYNKPALHSTLMMKSFFTICIQLFIVLIIAITSDFSFYRGSWEINFTRVFVCIVLHIQIAPEITLGIDMIRYAKNCPEKFYGHNRIYPYLLGLMKLSGGMFTEILNIVVISSSQDVPDVVQDYIVYGFIFEIDDYMATTVTTMDVAAEVDYPISCKNKFLSMSLFESLMYA